MDSTTCCHKFMWDVDGVHCLNCGLEQKEFVLDAEIKTCSNYSAKVSTDDLNCYLDELTIKDKSHIITVFESLLVKNNLRGTGKKALLAACYFYLAAQSMTLTSRDVSHKFKIDKKKFSEGKQIFLTHFPEYRTLERKISEFVDAIFKKFNLPLDNKDRVVTLCKQIDESIKFVNFSPYSVCACVVYKELSSSGLKKNAFLKQVGISEITVQKIGSCFKDLSAAPC
jgi:transcription initiation factor TFIIIB Brf1 subunit/transcription initiation factor TFIIB